MANRLDPIAAWPRTCKLGVSLNLEAERVFWLSWTSKSYKRRQEAQADFHLAEQLLTLHLHHCAACASSSLQEPRRPRRRARDVTPWQMEEAEENPLVRHALEAFQGLVTEVIRTPVARPQRRYDKHEARTSATDHDRPAALHMGSDRDEHVDRSRPRRPAPAGAHAQPPGARPTRRRARQPQPRSD